MLSIELNWKTVAAVYLFGMGVIWLTKSSLKEAKEVAMEMAPHINPVDESNIFNRGFESVWHAITGSDQSPGADIYDWIHGTGEEQGYLP